MPLHTCSTNQQIAKLTLHDYLHSDWVFEGAIGAPVNDYKSVSFYRTGSTSKKTVSSPQVSAITFSCCITLQLPGVITIAVALVMAALLHVL